MKEYLDAIYNDISVLIDQNNTTSLTRQYILYSSSNERLQTKTKNGKNFFDFLKLKPELLKKKYVLNMINHYEKKGLKLDNKIWWKMYCKRCVRKSKSLFWNACRNYYKY